MATRIDGFSDEQWRTLVNVAQRYQVWMEAEQALRAMPYNLVRKEVKGHSYLYEVVDRKGNARSLGPWTGEHEARLSGYQADKAEAKERRDRSREGLEETRRLYRALRLPLLSSAAGQILREADRRRLLGDSIVVVGTNAMPAYSIEAAGFIRDAPDETEGFDISWSAARMPEDVQPLWDTLKAVDANYTVNTERPFQARNAKAYEMELLVAPSRAETMRRTDKPQPSRCPSRNGC